MSVTVAKILELPSLRGASVVAGTNGLDRVVNAVSVLEYAKLTNEHQRLFESIEFPKGEIALTSFSTVADDVEAQCANVRQLASVGQVGLILYYVGIVMPAIDERLIRCADELDFVLICMPQNDPTLRYSEAISDIMDALFRNRESTASLAIDILEQMSRMPAQHRTVDTLLQIVAMMLRASVALADETNRVLAAATWPSKRTLPWEELLTQVESSGQATDLGAVDEAGPFWARRGRLNLDGRPDTSFAVLSEHGEIDPVQWEQAVDGVRLGMNLWGREHDEIAHVELVRSIVQDEPIRMRRLGKIYGIDVSALRDVWIVHNHGGACMARHVANIRRAAEHHANVVLCEHYEDNVLVFPIGPHTLSQVHELGGALDAWRQSADLDVSITHCVGLETTLGVKNAYRLNQDYVDYAREVFLTKHLFTLHEIAFAQRCKDIVEAGEGKLERQLLPLRTIGGGSTDAELLQTLATYLLDEDQSVVATAERLFVHKNTVKYRLQKASDALGYRIGSMPNTHDLMVALGIRRLLDAH